MATLAVPVALASLAAGLRFWGLGRQGLWFDEATTAWLVRGSPGHLLAVLPHTESTPPLYYLLAWGWVRVFSNTEVGLRSLSALAGVAAVPITYAAARELAGRRVALVAGLLVAVNPMLVWYSQEARSYSLLVLASAVSLWLLARARANPTRRRLMAWGACAAIAVCIHYFAIFLVLPEAALLFGTRVGSVRARLVAVAMPAVAVAALAALAHRQSTRVYRFTATPLPIRLRQVAQFSLVGFSPPSTLRLMGAAVAIGLAALVLLVLCGSRIEKRAALWAGVIAAGAVLVPTLLAVLGADYLNARNVIGVVVPLAVLLAAGLGAKRAGRAGLVLASALVLISLWMVAAVPANLYAQRPHWREVAKALAYEGRPRAILMLGSRTWARPLGFYLPHTGWPSRTGRLVTEIDVVRKILHPAFCPRGVWWGALCDVGPHAALTRPPMPGFRLVSSERVAGFAIARYRSPRPARIHAVWPAGARKHNVLITPAPAPVFR